MQNFAYPYFARDIRDFWRRWHISLTAWFRDYIYLPIAYSLSRKIKSKAFLGISPDWIIYIIGITVTWTLTGLWHGANYTFIIWGILQGVLLIIYRITLRPKKKFLRKINLNENNGILIFVETIATFIVVMFSWIFFRADNIGQALNYIYGIFSASFFTIPYFPGIEAALPTFIFIFFFMLVEWFGREQQYAIAQLWIKRQRPLRYAIYYLIIIAILWFGGTEQQFIYFQF